MIKKSTPASVGIIMDGNRRWAKAKGLPTFEGHRQGYEKLKEVLRWVKARGIGFLTVFALSTENWNRSKEEVAYLLDLIRLVLTVELQTIKNDGGKVVCIGQRERFPEDIRKLIVKAEQETANLKGPTLVLALSYGGRAEIIAAATEAAKKGTITEQTFTESLWTKNIPDPDLVIRTSGEMRLSGFLPWQTTYSELFFTKTLWPDFSEKEFDEILEEFSKRDRRKGV